MQFTLIFCGASSIASVLVMLIMADFVAAYGPADGDGPQAATDAMLMMFPPSVICSTAAFAPHQALFRFRSTSVSQTSSGCVDQRALGAVEIAARVVDPDRELPQFRDRRLGQAVVRGPVEHVHPHREGSPAPLPHLLRHGPRPRARAAPQPPRPRPLSAKARAMPRPMPRPPPVTTATCPSSRNWSRTPMRAHPTGPTPPR